MSAHQHAVDQREPCPESFALFLGFLIIAYGPDQKPGPGLREYVDRMLSRASAAGFAHADILTTMIANGEKDSPRVRHLATVLGEAIGDSEMIASIKDFADKRKAGTV